MLWTIIAILLVLWVLGIATSIGGGLIHLLLVLAIILLLVRLITGRRPVA
ncbi:MAG TPA: lmo0937 family membrane protein [Candidatus Kapabacteria bacterium]|nr:lmo0937 family membrane protein [Candidatus Kapabacteria bacterium]